MQCEECNKMISSQDTRAKERSNRTVLEAEIISLVSCYHDI